MVEWCSTRGQRERNWSLYLLHGDKSINVNEKPRCKNIGYCLCNLSDHCCSKSFPTISFFPRSHGSLIATLSGHTSWVLCVAFSPDNEHFVSGSSDRTVKVWEMATKQCVHTFSEHSDQVHLMELTRILRPTYNIWQSIFAAKYELVVPIYSKLWSPNRFGPSPTTPTGTRSSPSRRTGTSWCTTPSARSSALSNHFKYESVISIYPTTTFPSVPAFHRIKGDFAFSNQRYVFLTASAS